MSVRRPLPLLLAALASGAGAGARRADLPMPPPPVVKSSGPRAIRVAVLEPAVDPGMDQRVKAAIGQALTAEIRKLERVTAIAADEIQQMVSFQRSRQLMGCGEDTSCMAELVDALAADDLISMRVASLGQTSTFAVQRLDARRSKVAQSFTRQVPRGTGEELLALIGPAVETLFPERGLLRGKTRGVDRAMARKLNPPPLPRWAFFATAGTGAAAGAGGAVFGLLASQSYGRYQTLVDVSKTSVVEATQLDQARRETERSALFANAFLIGAGALALVAAFEAVFTDWNDDRAALALVPAPGGGLGLALRF
ncbi:MAG TPA: hypothetical protein VFB81_23865 [Myxococcales bacterium]|nr:hypothetical protein [Myxococcales bacterium]